MRKILGIVVGVLACAAFVVFQGCEWDSSGGEGFNTSRGAGIEVNFSGHYRPKAGYSTLILNSPVDPLYSGTAIAPSLTYFVLTQTASALEVVDNNNSYYTGQIGSPGVMSEPDRITGKYPAGAAMLQSQISFSGTSAASGKQVQFVGIVRLVAASEIRSQTFGTTAGGTVSSNSSFSITNPPVAFGDSSTYNADWTRGDFWTYSMNEGNSWYLMEGTWIEDGVSYPLAGRAPALSATFSLAPEVNTVGPGATSAAETNGSYTIGPLPLEPLIPMDDETP
jgi:hypothetical protein